MKKNAIAAAVGVGLTAISMSTQADLVTGTLLTVDPGVSACIGNVGTYPACTYGAIVVDGSFFSMSSTRTPVSSGSDGGLIMGIIQNGGGSHGGFPDGTENAPIDAAWGYFCNTGLHYTTSPVTVIDNDVNNDGGFTQTLDFSGWTVAWNGIPAIPLPGVATITCSLANCGDGGTYALDYATIIPPSTLHNFGGVPYGYHIKGIVSAVPVPAAVWLFGTGLVGLAGVAVRRKKSD
ncbi:MAG TPA: VPLPA-CTERM sorting domain-containing protein [Gammaproteobacteria bacterium]|nr:VPLPA-CTERM sorting domain-containing protein [Gammaproteobacteria bacterium]